jgi:hypothetical protein
MKRSDLDDLSRRAPLTGLGGAPVYIYGLIDPETGLIRYIGKSTRPIERLRAHCRERSACHRSNWLQSLATRGLEPEMVILERIEGAWPWQISERYWIAFARYHGWPITNNTSGGDGVRDLPEEARRKIAATWKGRKHKAETIEKLQAARRLRTTTDDTRAKMSKAHRGRVITWGAKISEATRRLSPVEVALIRGQLAAGALVKVLAGIHGVHRTTISKIKKGAYFGNSRR